jgi:hypothetical protein
MRWDLHKLTVFVNFVEMKRKRAWKAGFPKAVKKMNTI